MTNESVLINFLSDQADILWNYIDPTNGQVSDPYETIDSEGFSPPLVSIVLSSIYRKQRKEKDLHLALAALKRTFYLLENDVLGRKPFRDLFLSYFGLLALQLLQDELTSEEINSSCGILQTYIPSYTANLNGLCMSAVHRVNLSLFGIGNEQLENVSEMFAKIRSYQTSKGFLCDGMEKQSNPAIYHLLVFNLLCLTHNAIARLGNNASVALLDIKKQIQEIIHLEQGWMDHFIGNDGSLAVTERTSNHIWLCGAYAAYSFLRNGRDAYSKISRHFDYWRQATGDSRIYGLTCNALPIQYRTGAETYANTSQYVSLGAALVALAMDFPAQEQKAGKSAAIPRQKLFEDRQAGYVHWHNDNLSAGISISTKKDSTNGGYCLIGSIFNLCMNTSHRVLASPAAFPNSYVATQYRRSIAHDGFMLLPADKTAGAIWPRGEVADISISDDSRAITLSWRQDGVEANRYLISTSVGLLSIWELHLTDRMDVAEVTIPIVCDDGRKSRKISILDGYLQVQLLKSNAFIYANTDLQLDSTLENTSTSGFIRSARLKVPSTQLMPDKKLVLAHMISSQLPPSSRLLLANKNSIQFKLNEGEKKYQHYAFECQDEPLKSISNNPHLINFVKPLTLTVDIKLKKNSASAQVLLFVILWSNGEKIDTSIAFHLYSGKNRLPVHIDSSTTKVELAFRFSGFGEMQIHSIEVGGLL
jgi:hypothetical protein